MDKTTVTATYTEQYAAAIEQVNQIVSEFMTRYPAIKHTDLCSIEACIATMNPILRFAMHLVDEEHSDAPWETYHDASDDQWDEWDPMCRQWEDTDDAYIAAMKNRLRSA